jgi:hypothetical protein
MWPSCFEIFVIACLAILEGVFGIHLREPRRKPPWPVRLACYIEVFSAIILVVGVLLNLDNIPVWGSILLVLIGLCWLGAAVCAGLGRCWSRRVLLVLSGLRALTVIGVPFSVVSIYFLYRPKTSRAFFGGVCGHDGNSRAGGVFQTGTPGKLNDSG